MIQVRVTYRNPIGKQTQQTFNCDNLSAATRTILKEQAKPDSRTIEVSSVIEQWHRDGMIEATTGRQQWRKVSL
jgi:hypothetical protein